MENISPLRSIVVLPDSRGCIDKLLYHHSPVAQEGQITNEGIFRNFLTGFNKTGKKPMVYVIATYCNSSEKEALKKEADTWKDLVECLEYIDVQTTREFLKKPPYAQDTCIVLNSQKSSAIITKSSRVTNFQKFLSGVKKLITSAGLRIRKLEAKYNLEGGYEYATSTHLFYSNPDDKEIVKHSKQEPIFVDSLISDICEKMLEVFMKITGLTTTRLPDHVDLVISFLGRDDLFEVFYVDFRDTTLLNPLLTDSQRILLKNRFDEWDKKMNKLLRKIETSLNRVRFHKMPGVIGFESLPYSQYGVSGTAVLPYIYSGANLLFHSIHDRNYAFYLKYPNEIEEEQGLEINRKIEHVLKTSDVNPLPVSGDSEITNLIHIQNSAGIRCLVKPLFRSQ